MKKQELSELLGSKSPSAGEEIDIESVVEKDDSIVLAPENDNESNTSDSVIPNATDSMWTSYVMKHFATDELEGENPRVEGLRRVAELLVGEIIEERSELLSAPNVDNGFRAICKASILFETPNGVMKRFEGMADAYEGNLAPDFQIYLVTMAETRAKGRCFKNALKLKRIVSAEEIRSGEDKQDIPYGSESIDGGQITSIQIMCDRLNISVAKLMQNMELGKETLGSLTRTEGIMMAKRLGDYRSHGSVPSSILKST
jgi:hypothetical protein